MRIGKWPHFDSDEIEATKKVLISGKVNYWTGNECKLFEKEFSKFANTNFGIAIANGTLALDAAYEALAIKRGDEVITTPRTFIATASSAAIRGAKVKFADVDINSGCITPETIEPLINKKTKAISVVHLNGWPADMKGICDLAKNFGLYVIEDCAQAHGAKIEGNSVGSFGDVAAWSFCQDKIITTGGEGGFITTNNESIFTDICSFRDHGKNIALAKEPSKKIGFRWLHENLGSNLRLTEFQAAIGRLQLSKLSKWNIIRNRNSSIFKQNLKDCELVRIPIPKNSLTHAWYKFYVYLKPELFLPDWNREKVIGAINQKGYPAFTGSCSEIYLEKSLKKLGFAPMERLVNAKKLGETSIAFLVHPTISEKQMQEYSCQVRDILNMAKR